MTARPLSLQVLELARSSALTDDEQLAELASAVVMLVRRTGIPWAGVFTALATGLSLDEGGDQYSPLPHHLAAFGAALAQESRS